MILKSDDTAEAGQTHEGTLGLVTDDLKSLSWEVRTEPRIGVFRPDLVALSPEGEAFVVEVKTGPYGGHLGALAQLETYQGALASELGRPVHGVLVLDEAAPQQLLELGRGLGISIIDGARANPETLRTTLAGLVNRASPDPG